MPISCRMNYIISPCRCSGRTEVLLKGMLQRNWIEKMGQNICFLCAKREADILLELHWSFKCANNLTINHNLIYCESNMLEKIALYRLSHEICLNYRCHLWRLSEIYQGKLNGSRYNIWNQFQITNRQCFNKARIFLSLDSKIGYSLSLNVSWQTLGFTKSKYMRVWLLKNVWETLVSEVLLFHRIMIFTNFLGPSSHFALTASSLLKLTCISQ